MTLHLRLLLFGRFAEVLRATELPVVLSPGATVADALAELRRAPGGEQLPEQLLVALNGKQAAYTDALSSGDELALLPPLAGG